MFLKLFKFSRLLTPSAWKNLDLMDTISYLVILICGLTITWLESCVTVEDDPIVKLISYVGPVISVGALFSLIADTLWRVCGPTKRYKLNKGKTRLFVYKSQTLHKHDLFELVVHTKDGFFTKYAEEYNVPFADKNATCFTFRAAADNNSDWLSCNVQTGQTEVLGKRLNKILFISPEKAGLLNILIADGSVKKIESDYIVYDAWHIPDGAKLQVPQDVDSRIKSFPDKFLCIKKDGMYKTYGFFLSDKKTGYSEVFISSVIFREGRDRLLLEFDGAVYKERLRTQELSRKLSNYFLELTDDYRIGGKVYCYDGKTKSLDVIYEGNFLWIEFDDGTILGDDRKVYGPSMPKFTVQVC